MKLSDQGSFHGTVSVARWRRSSPLLRCSSSALRMPRPRRTACKLVTVAEMQQIMGPLKRRADEHRSQVGRDHAALHALQGAELRPGHVA